MRIGLVWSHCLLQLLVESAEIISVKFRLRVTTVVLCATVSILLCVYLIFMQRCVSTLSKCAAFARSVAPSTARAHSSMRASLRYVTHP